jgi:acyl phosphate:glycerol-3-phosphate acyltransferase
MEATTLVVAIVSIAAAYLIGGIPWGVLLARVVGGPDPRTLGSGRTGGANVLRALGPRVAVTAAVLDLSKGCVAVAIPIVLGAGVLVQGLAVLAAIIGHSRSVFIGFQGGRGVSPAFGALLVLWPVVALVVIPIFVAVVQLTRYSSLASLTASGLTGVILIGVIVAQGLPPAHLVYAIGGPALIWIFHRDNISRLLAGRERTIDQRTDVKP